MKNCLYMHIFNLSHSRKWLSFEFNMFSRDEVIKHVDIIQVAIIRDATLKRGTPVIRRPR